jgi:hypothetical protein
MRDFRFCKLHDNRFTRPVKPLIVRLIAAGKASRRILNHYYSSLGAEARANFYMRYAKVFRQRGVSLSPGEWKIRFVGREILLPLRTSWSWLDWDNAVSIVGHDIEVKETYAALVESDQRPNLFWILERTTGRTQCFSCRLESQSLLSSQTRVALCTTRRCAK